MIDPTTARRTGTAFALVLLATALFGCGDSSSSAPGSGSPASGSTGAAPAEARSAPVPMAMPSGPRTPADEAWDQLEQRLSKPPEPPESWATKEPDEAAIREFQRQRADAAVELADLARDFQSKHAQDPRATSAVWMEIQLLDAAMKLGRTNVSDRLAALEKGRLDDPASTDDERFAIARTRAERAAQLAFGDSRNLEAARKSMIQSAKDLITQFPKRPEPYMILLSAVEDAPVEEALATATSLVSTNVPEEVRELAQAMVTKLERVGKPLELKFTAIDGRETDLAALKGKVVLVDFWATWCGPCIASFPNVAEVVKRYEGYDVAVVGVTSLQGFVSGLEGGRVDTKGNPEKEMALMKDFMKAKAMTWTVAFSQQEVFNPDYGILGIPYVAIIAPDGTVRHAGLHPGGSLAEKAEKIDAILKEFKLKAPATLEKSS